MQKGDAMDAAERSERIPDIVIITGMSGSGRTQAMHVFEDMGYFCIDNLPPRLIAQLAELVGINTGVGRHLAVTCDLRSQGLFDELLDAVAALEEREMSCDIVFLEASDEVLIRRYSENRRRHPIAKPGETTADAIQRERLQLQGVRDRADMIIDTSRLRTSALRNKLRMAFSELSDQQLMDVHVFSFGFKHGMPVEADIMIDVRFLPNPFYDPEMRTMTGLDKKVSDFVLDHPKTQEFWKAWTQLLDTVMPGSSLYDFGDSIRFGAATAAEDERDLSRMEMSLERFRIFTRGYVRSCPGLTQKELELLPLGAKTMTMECGVRFLTDYLDGDHYFAVHRDGQNLDRARTQFKLVADMEKKWNEMQKIVAEEAKKEK